MHQALTLSKNFNCSSMNTIWYASQPEIDVTALSLPFLQHELILNLGDTFNVSYAHTNQETLFSPIQAKAITTEVSGKYQAMGVLFPPVGIYEMYGISVAELKTSEELLFGKQEELYARTREQDSPRKKIEVLSSFLAKNSVNKKCPDVVVNFLKAVSLATQNPLKIKKIAEQLHFSSKHLASTFRDITGITPKKYVQLLQLNHALGTMLRHPKKRLTETALEHDFYDQAHFTRKFKAFSGMTPYAFRSQRLAQPHDFLNTLVL